MQRDEEQQVCSASVKAVEDGDRPFDTIGVRIRGET